MTNEEWKQGWIESNKQPLRQPRWYDDLWLRMLFLAAFVVYAIGVLSGITWVVKYWFN